MNHEKMPERYGPWALVTGASSGIGRSVAVELAERGMNLVLVARRGELLRQLASEIQARHGAAARVVEADLGNRDAVQSVIDQTEDLDIGLLVANAGYGTSGELVDADLDAELDMVRVNVDAVLMLSHAFAGRLRARGRGGIVLMSSIVAFQGVPRQANYAATKAYVHSLGEALRLELRPHGIDVLIAAPGPVASGFAERADMKMGDVLSPDSVAAGIVNALGHSSTIRPGLRSKVLGYSLATTPRRLRTRILAGVIGGFTRHQRIAEQGSRSPYAGSPQSADRRPSEDGSRSAEHENA